MKRLTPQAIKMINNTGMLFGQIADVLDIAPTYLRKLLVDNTDERLSSEPVVSLVKNHLSDMQIVADLQAA